METTNSAELIKTIIAPAVMISACGLIFLALTNRYLTITQRIRTLNEELRRIIYSKPDSTELEYHEKIRTNILQIQLKDFLKRGSMLRNSLTFIIIAIGFYIISSLTIAVVLFSQDQKFQTVTLMLFLLGLVSLLIGVIISVVEIRLSYRNITIEVNAD